MNIPCQDWKRSLVGTMHSIGTLFALPIVGAFSDRFGRRHALILSSLMEGIFGISKSLAINYPMFLTLEASEPVLGSGTFSSAYILGEKIFFNVFFFTLTLLFITHLVIVTIICF